MPNEFRGIFLRRTVRAAQILRRPGSSCAGRPLQHPALRSVRAALVLAGADDAVVSAQYPDLVRIRAR
jgi:hypothetical protein